MFSVIIQRPNVLTMLLPSPQLCMLFFFLFWFTLKNQTTTLNRFMLGDPYIFASYQESESLRWIERGRECVFHGWKEGNRQSKHWKRKIDIQSIASEEENRSSKHWKRKIDCQQHREKKIDIQSIALEQENGSSVASGEENRWSVACFAFFVFHLLTTTQCFVKGKPFSLPSQVQLLRAGTLA